MIKLRLTEGAARPLNGCVITITSTTTTSTTTNYYYIIIDIYI